MQLYNDKLNSTCLGASQAKGLRASKVTIQGDTDVPRENQIYKMESKPVI
jgi:hypothetical protein